MEDTHWVENYSMGDTYWVEDSSMVDTHWFRIALWGTHTG